jgi:hypothetical protein
VRAEFKGRGTIQIHFLRSVPLRGRLMTGDCFLRNSSPMEVRCELDSGMSISLAILIPLR